MVVRAAVVSQIAGDVMATVTVLVATSAAEIEYLSDRFQQEQKFNDRIPRLELKKSKLINQRPSVTVRDHITIWS